MLLAGSHPILASLRDQAMVAAVGSRSPASPQRGTVVALIVPGTKLRVDPRSFTLDDVGFQLVGAEQEGDAEVNVVGGLIAKLKFYNLIDPWPADPQISRLFYRITSASVGDWSSDQRGMNALKQKLEKK
jgi:hypothetical protein